MGKGPTKQDIEIMKEDFERKPTFQCRYENCNGYYSGKKYSEHLRLHYIREIRNCKHYVFGVSRATKSWLDCEICYRPRIVPCRFQCEICSERFETHALKKKHENSHKTYKCDDCGLEFKELEKLHAHLKSGYQKEHVTNLRKRKDHRF